jgi:hypothetical protein
MEQHPKYNSIWMIPRLTVKIVVGNPRSNGGDTFACTSITWCE